MFSLQVLISIVTVFIYGWLLQKLLVGAFHKNPVSEVMFVVDCVLGVLATITFVASFLLIWLT